MRTTPELSPPSPDFPTTPTGGQSPQPSHINLTTDVDMSQPLVAEAGENVKFVASVTAYPPSLLEEVELFWIKGGKRLKEDNHYHVNRTNSSIILEIRQLTRADADIYVLHGRAKDVNSSLAIALEVKGNAFYNLKTLNLACIRNCF
ncbi:receptor protein-tyrosine kinase [Trichonephila clavipes]|nr:receptor protein-tyrosine kinase [Trichonephila clavipes]